MTGGIINILNKTKRKIMSEIIKNYIKEILFESDFTRTVIPTKTPITSKSDEEVVEDKIEMSDGMHKSSTIKLNKSSDIPIVLTILNDMEEDDDDDDDDDDKPYPIMKEFLAFSRPNFYSNYVDSISEGILENPFLKMNFDIYIMSRNAAKIQEVNIGLSSPVRVVYVLASSILDKNSNLKLSNLKRKYSNLNGYIYSSIVARQEIQRSLQDLGLVFVGIDIKEIRDKETIQRFFEKAFISFNWDKYMRMLGLEVSRSDKDVKDLSKTYGLDKDVTAMSSKDLIIHMSEIENKNEFEDIIFDFLIMLFYFEVFENAEDWTYTKYLEMFDYDKLTDLKYEIKLEFLDLMYDSVRAFKSLQASKKLKEYDEVERLLIKLEKLEKSFKKSDKSSKIIKMVKENYASIWKQFIFEKFSYLEMKRSKNMENIKFLNKDTITRAYQLMKDKDIVLDSNGDPTNLNKEERSLYYKTFTDDFKFIFSGQLKMIVSKIRRDQRKLVPIHYQTPSHYEPGSKEAKAYSQTFDAWRKQEIIKKNLKNPK